MPNSPKNELPIIDRATLDAHIPTYPHSAPPTSSAPSKLINTLTNTTASNTINFDTYSYSMHIIETRPSTTSEFP